ncbi:MAG: hypothetical protein COA43_07905 [Robiginitomaculum sp.]|nr:MAG: hypothetical protein COA43_07905 [Robiginitomaculum sp.]
MSTKNNPLPLLTATPSPTLDWSREGTPASHEYDDIYFSVDGGKEETAAVFFQGCHLPQAWLEHAPNLQPFTICELGFGSGLNFLATWALWLDSMNSDAAPKNARLHFISIEAYPWTKEDLAKALAHWPSLALFAAQLIANWPGQVKGVHRLHFGNVTLTLYHMQARSALSVMDFKMHAWFLDGFSPSKNPDMWSQEIFTRLAQRSHIGARLGTFTVASHVRHGLAEAGFHVEKKPGFGKKRERLEATYTGTNTDSSANTPTSTQPIIIGGGIAGASIARAFARRGVTPLLIDPEPNLDSAASGNPAALVMPRLDLQDRPESRFFLSAYLYALTQYTQTHPPLQTGITQIAKSEAERKRFVKLLTQQVLPPDQMQALDHIGIKDKTGLSLEDNMTGLYFQNALLIEPKSIIQSWTSKCQRLEATVERLEKIGGVWHIYDNDNICIAKSQSVFLCVGANVQKFTSTKIRFIRGQISWGDSDCIPHASLIYSGYAAPYKNGILLGATHTHIENGYDIDIRPEDTLANIAQYEALIAQTLVPIQWQARASIRVTTHDTLPIAYQNDEGIFVMSGLGARGFMMAPLLGEALVCQNLAEPSPLCSETQLRFTPK